MPMHRTIGSEPEIHLWSGILMPDVPGRAEEQ